MKILLLFEGMLHRGLAASNRCIAYSQILSEGDSIPKILVPFSFKARKEMPSKSKGELNNIAFEYVSYISYHPKEKHSLIVAGILMYYSKIKGYSKLLFRLLLKRSEYDVVFVYEFSVFYSFLIRVFCWGKPLVFEICEIPFFDIQDSRLRLKKRRQRENWNYKLADGFITISDPLTQYIRDLFPNENKKWVQIPILSSEFMEPTGELATIEKIEQPYIVHTGTLTERKDGFLTILRAIGKLKTIYNKEVLLYCTGSIDNSSVRSEAKNIINKYDLTGLIFFTGYLEKQELEELIKNASFAIVYKYLNEQNTYCFPTKVASYLSLGLPLIVTNVGQLEIDFKNDENALIVNPGDEKGLISAMNELIDNKNKREFIGKNGLKLFNKKYRLAVNVEPLVAFYKKIAVRR